MKKQTVMLLVSASLATAALGGCGGKEQTSAEKTEAPAPPKPVTIRYLWNPAEELFNKTIKEPVEKKYPHITLQQVRLGSGVTLDSLMLAGEMPDIMRSVSIYDLIDKDLAEDLKPYISKSGLDTSKFDKVIWEAVNSLYMDAQGHLLALPPATNFANLYYNKDLFDRFNVPYPKNGMTWDEVWELSKRLTRSDGGTQYYGLDIQMASVLDYNQLSLPVVDKRTNKATVNSDGWQLWFNTMKRFYESDQKQGFFNNAVTDSFLKKRNLGMIAISSLFADLAAQQNSGMNWDVVTLPSFSGRPNTQIQPWMAPLAIYKNSKNKEEAWRVIEAEASRDIQAHSAKQGSYIILNDPAMLKSFGEEVPALKGKNVSAIYTNAFAPVASSSTKYDAKAYRLLEAAFKDVVVKGTDVNTALRQADEAINKMIDEQLKAQK
ncbi:MAG: family 1 extracellular solute-binding protein [Paenibacillus sp.]|nr:family 1 extracellular solute-binding protein [Paenibacillus sp.]